MQVNSAFRAFWLASSEVNRKYYSPLSKRRETKWLPVLCRLLRSKFYWLIIQIVWYVLIKQVFVLTSCWLKWWIFTSTLVNNYCFFSIDLSYHIGSWSHGPTVFWTLVILPFCITLGLLWWSRTVTSMSR